MTIMTLSGNNDKYGINVRQWCREHETYIEQHKGDTDPERLLAWHQEKPRWAVLLWYMVNVR